MTITTHVRDQLADVQSRKTELRDRLKAAKAQRDSAREAFAHDGGDPDRDSPEYRAAGRAVEAVHHVERQLVLAEDEERFLLNHAAGMDGAGVNADSFTHNPEMLASLAQMATSSAPVGRVQLGSFVNREQVAAMTGRALTLAGDALPTDRSREAPHRGIVPALQRPLSFLDLLVSEPMEGSSLPYLQETGDPAGAAAVVAEGAVKPAATITYADAEAKAVTIAHYTKVRRQALADVAQLSTTLRSRLMYGVLRKLEQQVISGDGVGENITGILNTAGIGAPDVSGDTLAADKTLEGLVTVLVSGAVPNVIALHPRAWADMVKAKATTSGEYFSGGPFIATAQALWGTQVVPALGVPEDVALVGDTTIGATLLIREGVNVLISDSDQDDFLRNQIALLGEMRAGLAVWIPSAWAMVDLT